MWTWSAFGLVVCVGSGCEGACESGVWDAWFVLCIVVPVLVARV